MRGGHAGVGYLPYIDGLRAIAVLAVIAYHLAPAWLPGGFTGVDVFFVISGFVVSASVARSEGQGVLAAWSGFYARRLKRIVPPLLACLLATTVASAVFIPDAWLSDTSERTGLMAFFGLSNWVLAQTGSDYFSPRAEFNPYTHTWSLGVEEQFYLLFPLLFLPWIKGGRLRLVSACLVAACLAASVVHAWHVGLRGTNTAAAFYLTPGRLWQLAAGVSLFQTMALSGGLATSPPAAGAGRAAMRGLGIAGALGLLVAGLVLARPGQSPWPDGAWPVVGTLGLLWLLFHGRAGFVGKCLSSAPMVAIGRLSYSLYLWHWPVFVLFRWTVGLDTWPLRAAALATAVVLAIASYRLVECPIRYAPRLIRMPAWRLVAATAVVVVACGASHVLLVKQGPAYSLSVVTRHAEDWYPGRGVPDQGAGGCRVEKVTRTAGAAGAWVYRRTGCMAAAESGRIFVAGDSHAAVYTGMLQHLVLRTGREVTLYAVGGCPLVAMQPAREREPGCMAYGTDVLADVLARASAGDVLFLPSLRLPRLSEQWMVFDEAAAIRSMQGPGAREARQETATTALARLAPLAERGIRIVFEAPTPVFRAPAYRCSDWFNRGNPICVRGLTIERAFLEQLRGPVLETLARIASALPAASVWDPFPVLCPGEVCHANDGKPLFFDGDHLSGHANRILLPGFVAHVDALSAAPIARGHPGP